MRFLFVALAFSVSASQTLAEQHLNAIVSVCFTPAERCDARIVDAIDKAQSSIRVQAYGFTSLPIIHALQRAARREVEVLAILDKVNDRKYSGATLLEAAGIPVWIDFEPAIAHNKILVIDSRLVIGGSYNFTQAAQKRNAENVTFIESPQIARQFLDYWEARLKVSRVFDGSSQEITDE
ncbi:phospholipase D family protein [Rhizobium sp. BR 315]|uniref:phospholipase D family nuclease n=1 Tax=Rhizobium sp. BR 315 TaxID=3040014 RepID=UPI003D32D748